jgi:hypothetical protein
VRRRHTTLRGRFFMHNLPRSCTDKNSTHAAIAIQTYISKAKYYSELDQETALLQVEGVKYGLQMSGIAAHSRSNLLLFAIRGVSRKHPYPAPTLPMRRWQLCSRSCRTRLCLAASSVAMVGGVTPCSMCQTSITSITSRSIIRNHLPTSKTISAEWTISGTRRSVICANSTVSQRLISRCFQRNASGALTTVTRRSII